MRFEANGVSADLDLENGGRLSSLVVAGDELLVNDAEFTTNPVAWGAYPMVPWAGRIRHGHFNLNGEMFEVPITDLGDQVRPHAIHGVAYLGEWRQLDDNTIGLDLDETWPFGGSVTHRVDLADNSIELTLTITAADTAMPAMLGWHPWFRRQLQLDGPAAELRWDPKQMYAIDGEAIPTGKLVKTPPGPWDNCFLDVEEQPTIQWGNDLSLRIQSDCSHWVVYTEPEHALCIEPQSEAPDVFNRNPALIEPGKSMTRYMRLSWDVG